MLSIIKAVLNNYGIELGSVRTETWYKNYYNLCKFAGKPSTSCVRIACRKLSTSCSKLLTRIYNYNYNYNYNVALTTLIQSCCNKIVTNFTTQVVTILLYDRSIKTLFQSTFPSLDHGKYTVRIVLKIIKIYTLSYC